MKKITLLLIELIGINYFVTAQVSGDYRSVSSGNWNDVTKWEVYNGSSWATANAYPGQNPGTGMVTISNQTAIKITASVPNPVSSLYISADYVCGCPDDNYGQNVSFGKLTFSAESAVSL